MFTLILDFITEYLLVGMGCLLAFALITRYLTFRASRRDFSFYSSFTREVEKKLSQDSFENVQVENIDDYINELLDSISKKLPKRKLRSNPNKKISNKKQQYGQDRVSSLREYVGGNNSVINGLKDEASTFKGNNMPTFYEVANRILFKDDNWVKLYGLMRIDRASRLIDSLPGIFIVLGIFGTFIGISNALPQVAQIDFSNIEGSSGVLSHFVLDVTYAMKTSIAGIMCSLVLTLINTLYPIAKMRETIISKLEHTLENLWYFFQGDAPERKRDLVFENILESLNNIEKKLGPTAKNAKKAA